MTSQIHHAAAVESNPPYPPPPAAPPKKRSGLLTLVGLLVLIVGVMLLPVAMIGLAIWSERDAIDRAQPGDCLRFTDEPEQPYSVMDCADPAAGFTLLATKPTARECVDVPGASRWVTDDERSYCIGEKGVDVSKAINDIKAGECLIFDGDKPSKAACRKGSIPVLLVLKDVDKTADSKALGSLCVKGGAEDARRAYTWGISFGTWDRLLCLGPPKK
jgi:hypothetical protein